MKVLFATTNPAKIKKYADKLQERNIEVLTIKDLEIIQTESEKEKNKTVSEFDLEKLKWSDIPFFVIILSASTSQSDESLSQMEIRGVKINQYGSSEGVDSTEMNEMVKFIALGELIPFRRIK